MTEMNDMTQTVKCTCINCNKKFNLEVQNCCSKKCAAVWREKKLKLKVRKPINTAKVFNLPIFKNRC